MITRPSHAFRKVHVTMQTLELLDGEYIYEDGTDKAKADPVLIKHNIQTYLIVPQFSDDSNVSINYYM